MKAVIVDLDGTLCDCRHRLHHVQAGARDWLAFFAGIPDDNPVEPIRRMVQTLAKDYQIVLCSGRPEEYRKTTVKWLDEWAVPFDSLYMRATGDYRPDHVVKMQLLAGIRADGFDPFLVVDDRPSVIEAWREAGLVCLQAAHSDESNVPDTARLTLMVGPSGCGKTTWLAEHAKPSLGKLYYHPSWVISSDQTRADLFGDFRYQGGNDQVYAALFAVVNARLKAGLPTVVDATNIRTKDRTSLATLMNVPVQYVVLNRPMADKRRDGGWRNEVDGGKYDLIGKHEQTFQSNLKAILAGDGLLNVTVVDLRKIPELEVTPPWHKEAA